MIVVRSTRAEIERRSDGDYHVQGDGFFTVVSGELVRQMGCPTFIEITVGVISPAAGDVDDDCDPI